MHRRVSIARSMAVNESKMFLYDEPTAGLDPINADNICSVILDLAKKGRGFVIITHKVTDAIKVADRYIFLKEGIVIFNGDEEELVRTTIPQVQLFMSELNLGLKRP
jgi:ABC-type transporter Mla maintaining outer membrane lipid asymmetry ATPase subunit MlaF